MAFSFQEIAEANTLDIFYQNLTNYIFLYMLFLTVNLHCLKH